MIFLSAGHHNKDSGAVANGYTEAALTKQLRDAIARHLTVPYITDDDGETLQQYIARIKPGDGSVLLDLHFNAGQPSAHGIECLIADENSKAMATELCHAGELIGLRNRGVKNEAQSQHKRLGILHDGAGIACLLEVCFITNQADLDYYFAGVDCFAKSIAFILAKYE